MTKKMEQILCCKYTFSNRTILHNCSTIYSKRMPCAKNSWVLLLDCLSHPAPQIRETGWPEMILMSERRSEGARWQNLVGHCCKPHPREERVMITLMSKDWLHRKPIYLSLQFWMHAIWTKVFITVQSKNSIPNSHASIGLVTWNWYPPG